MTITADQQNFIDQVAPYAQVAAQQTGVPWQTIVAQWADETGWGTAPAFTQGNNFAGVSPGGSVASYPSLAAGLAAYIQTLQQPIYASVKNAAAQAAANNQDAPAAAAQALGASPWAGSHYSASGGGPGSDLVAILSAAGLDPSSAVLASTGSSVGGAIGGLYPGGALPGSIVGGAAQSGAGGIASSVVSDLVSAARKPVLMAAFLTLAAALVLVGAWQAVKPTVQPAIDSATDKAKEAASVAAVAAA